MVNNTKAVVVSEDTLNYLKKLKLCKGDVLNDVLRRALKLEEED